MKPQSPAWKGLTQRLKQVITLKKSLFTKLLLSYLITVLVPTVVISSFYMYTHSNEVLDRIHNESVAKMQIFNRSISMVLADMDRFMVQTSFISGLDAMLRNPDHVDIYDYNVLKEYLRNQISANPLFYSIYFYFRLNDKVLTSNEGFYKLPEFYDRGPAEEVKRKNDVSGFVIQRILHDELRGSSVDVLTFNKRLCRLRIQSRSVT